VDTDRPKKPGGRVTAQAVGQRQKKLKRRKRLKWWRFVVSATGREK
jgi:alkylated DNA nucleotide flippase Atl1